MLEFVWDEVASYGSDYHGRSSYKSCSGNNCFCRRHVDIRKHVLRHKLNMGMEFLDGIGLNESWGETFLGYTVDFEAKESEEIGHNAFHLVFHGSIPPSRTGGGATKEAPPRVDSGSGDFSLVIKSSSRPQKRVTTHHRKKGPRKTKPWDVRLGPADTVVEASSPPLPLSAMTTSFPDLPSSENGYEREGEDGEDER
ncbi:hypothetical protein RJ640_002461 [Escallonia rubra]|uniref:Uncharacterized protein n=1 Tax=Escallonia rubra TaxID=112253 RepID=A0AA88RHE2_9ASTE|nr:hypothetical protein RJ640_002461 [Escallonia rubra]